MYLDRFHRVVLVQLVDVVGDAGVERRRRDRVDDSGFVCLLLVALAVRVDEQGDQTAQDGATEANGNHVEEVEVWRRRRGTFILFYVTINRYFNQKSKNTMKNCFYDNNYPLSQKNCMLFTVIRDWLVL